MTSQQLTTLIPQLSQFHVRTTPKLIFVELDIMQGVYAGEGGLEVLGQAITDLIALGFDKIHTIDLDYSRDGELQGIPLTFACGMDEFVERNISQVSKVVMSENY